MSSVWLIPTSGPTIEAMELQPSDGGLTIGRHEQCELRLPVDAEQVSRQHARFVFEQNGWRMIDLGSRWGTFVNGVRLLPKAEMPLHEGDLIRITPWTFTLSSRKHQRGLQLQEDVGQTVIRAVSQRNAQPLQENMLNLLLEAATHIYAATEEKDLVDCLMDAASRGTGLMNAVVLRPVDSMTSFEVMSSKVSTQAQNSPATFSRSLIHAASLGDVAEISSGTGGDFSQSLVQMNVSAAICVPLMLGASPAAFLYMDSRGNALQPLRANASAFCVALSRMGSLALSNIKRVEMEKRQTAINAELDAAAAAQKWIMPQRESAFGQLIAIGESKAGQFVGGDFFDIVPLADGKLAVAVADVSGKGVSASVLMTATQGFLHAALEQYEEPGRAVTALNRFIAPRRPSNRFVTLWVGVIDPVKQTLTYVDAAHSFAILRQANGGMQQLCEGGGLPMGVMDDSEYQSIEVPFAPGDQLAVVSDGIIEQPTNQPGERDQFEIEGLMRVMSDASIDPVRDIFKAVIQHAGTDQLADDATAVVIRHAMV